MTSQAIGPKPSAAREQPSVNGGSLVRGGHVLTSEERDHIVDGAVRILGGQIDAVGAWPVLRARFPDDEVTGGPHDIVAPGFINTHGHFSEALIVGLAKQFTLWEWVAALINPIAPHLDEERAHVGTLLAGIQMLKTGITLVNDMFVCDPQAGEASTPGVMRALDELGLRGIVSFGAGDVRGASVVSIMREHEALATAATASRLSRFRVGIAAVGAQSDGLFPESVRLSDGAGSHIHLQEIREEVTASRNRFGATSIAHCARAGLFEAPTIAAHCVWVDPDDREILAANDVGVAHNPVSNMILASGVCPVIEMRQLGIAVGIGVDGPASNDRQDMLEAIKTTVLLQRVDKLQATAFSARQAFAMATIGGARALGMETEVGSIAPGKAADLVVFDGDDPALANVYDPYAAIVYSAGPGQVKDVWVAGNRAVIGGKVVNVDELEVVARSRPLSRALVAQAGVA